MLEPLFRRLRIRDHLASEEEETLRAAVSEMRVFDAGETVIHEGDELTCSIVLSSGFMCRYKDMREGQRQITELNLAGDFVDLHGFTLKRLDHNVMAMSRCVVALVPHEKLTKITEEHPHLTRLLWFTTNLDAAVHREWVLSLGRRPALQRLAHLFCELHCRLEMVGLAQGDEPFPLPLRQIDLADCLGLTTVHVNRVMQELRESGFFEFHKGHVTIGDIGALRDLAEFDPAYLHLERRPR